MAGGHWELWVPSLVLAHVFALYWFGRIFRLANPQWRWPWATACVGTGTQQPCQQASRNSSAFQGITMLADLHASAPPPAQPVWIEWNNLCCSYRVANGTKLVLQGITGKAGPGALHALLGPSGAGKSTCIDILSHRKSVGSLSGTVLLNGHPATAQSVAGLSSYVPQEDNFMAQMTAGETLGFHASMALPSSMSPDARQARVLDVLAVVGLAQSGSTMVGGYLPGGLAMRGLSGGERKRLAIAVGLLSAPSIIFVDEATSGLDSFAAIQVMRYIRSMADDGNRLVITSIHQPRGTIWGMFDAVTVLSCGLMMYSGPCDQMVPWFTDGLHRQLSCDTFPHQTEEGPGFKFTYSPEEHGVASDWVIDLVSLGFDRAGSGPAVGCERQSFQSLDALHQAAAAFATYQQSGMMCPEPLCGTSGPWTGAAKVVGDDKMALHLTQQIVVQVAPGATSPTASNLPSSLTCPLPHADSSHGSSDVTDSAQEDSPQHGKSAVLSIESSSTCLDPSQQPVCRANMGAKATVVRSWQHFRALLWRETAAITRNPADVAGRMLTYAWIAVFAGLVFNNIPHTFESTQLRLNVHFSNTAFFLLMPYISMSLFTADRKQYLADASARLYHPATYYCAKVCATLPFNILSAVLYCLIVHGMAGLREGVLPVVQSTSITTLVSLIAVQILHAAATLAPNQDLAFMLAIGWTALNLLLSGFFIRYKQFAFSALSFLRWVSAQGYAFEGLAQVELGGATFDCSQGIDGTQQQLLSVLLPNLPPAQIGAFEALLQRQGSACVAHADAVLQYFDLHRGFSRTIIILCSYWAAAHVLTYVLLLVASRKERR